MIAVVAAAFYWEQEGGAHFRQYEYREEAEPAAFLDDDRQVGEAAEHLEAAIHQGPAAGSII